MTQHEAVLGIDLGTSGLKSALVGFDGRVLGMGRGAYATDRPRPGWVEQDPGAWWSAAVGATRAALAEARARPGAGGSDVVVLRSISVVGQGPTTACLGADGAVLRPAITWLDSRSSGERAELEARLEVPSLQLGALPHERWLAAHEPSVHEATAWFLSPWDWLVLRLSGEVIRSVPPGSRHPADATLSAGGADPARFGRIVEWGTRVGAMGAAAAAELGLPPGLPVIAGGNDALASFHGAGLADPGDAIDTGGTSGGFAVYWDDERDVPGTYRAPAALPGRWLYGGAMNAMGASFDWLASVLGVDVTSATDAADLLALAAATPPGADGLVFLPYLAGERSPIWDEAARGLLAGLTLQHERGHLARAVLEGGAFALRHVAEPIVAAGVSVRQMVVSGGTASNGLWSQVKADVTGFPVAVPEVPETAALGAAILAALGVGGYPDAVSAMRAMVRFAAVIEPRPEVRSRYDEAYAVYRALYPATAPLLHRLSASS